MTNIAEHLANITPFLEAHKKANRDYDYLYDKFDETRRNFGFTPEFAQKYLDEQWPELGVYAKDIRFAAGDLYFKVVWDKDDWHSPSVEGGYYDETLRQMDVNDIRPRVNWTGFGRHGDDPIAFVDKYAKMILATNGLVKMAIDMRTEIEPRVQEAYKATRDASKHLNNARKLVMVAVLSAVAREIDDLVTKGPFSDTTLRKKISKMSEVVYDIVERLSINFYYGKTRKYDHNVVDAINTRLEDQGKTWRISLANINKVPTTVDAKETE